MDTFRRLLRHLSFSNVLACLALFAALGGSAYAGSQINGNKIVKHSIGAGKLKNRTITGNQIKDETITSRQIKKGSLDAAVIDLSTLPPAQSAQTATTANSARTAAKATTASTATNAVHADASDSATNAAHANVADSATNATHADTATSATHADTAGDAETLDGKTAAQLTDACPAATELFGGMCWDTAPRPAANWFEATSTCGEAGGRLPMLSELVAFVLRDGNQAPQQVWSGDVAGVGAEEEVLTSDETKRESIGPKIKLGYHCLFYRTNAS